MFCNVASLYDAAVAATLAWRNVAPCPGGIQCDPYHGVTLHKLFHSVWGTLDRNNIPISRQLERIGSRNVTKWVMLVQY